MPKPHRPSRRSSHRPPEKRPTTDWSGVAQWYDQLVGDEGSEYQRQVVLPGVMKLLGPCAEKRVLDVACGQGVLCRLLHGAGAKVVGVDAAAPLIAMARQRSDPAIRFMVADARELDRVPDLSAATFDAAVCVLAIQNIQPFAPVFQGVARLLKPGGHLVIAMMHPCFRGPKQSHWGWDDAAGVQFRRVDRYLQPRKEPIVTHPGKDPGRYTWTFHRPLEMYIKTLAAAGLLVDSLEEWPSHKVSDSGPRAPAENVARREIPMFMAIRAVKRGMQVSEK